MNFFGHAAVASWHAAPPARGPTALGAMLPDFQAMTGARATAIADATVAAGVELHHKTDAVFHRLPAVTGLMRELFDALSRGGVSRGPARAASHAGMEMLLDGVLVDEPAHRDAYLEALAIDPVPVTFDADIAPLFARLRAHGVPYDLRRPDAVAARLLRMTADRPLLRATGDEPDRMRAALAAFRPRIEVAAATVVRALRAGLGPTG